MAAAVKGSGEDGGYVLGCAFVLRVLDLDKDPRYLNIPKQQKHMICC